MKFWLQHPWLSGDSAEIPVERFPFVIGRHQDADYSLALAFISRYHCRFTLADQQVLVQDLESHNGTFVNGRRITMATPLQHGDEVGLGPIVFRVILTPEPQETARSYQFGPTDRLPSFKGQRTEGIRDQNLDS
ncbi:MAG: FHA domain-containing protein [Gemmataceae bacterium]|nr:FHA domain-containing protein [Gemmataceae bacterium]